MSRGFARSPELMFGLGAIVVLPVLAIFGAVLRRRPIRTTTEMVVMDRDYVADWRQSITVQIEGSNSPPSTIGKGLTRIGRQEDNEICIHDASVHRYHAVIERSPDHGIRICDVSGPDGNGVRLNGERVSAAPLKHGDIVELGKARLRVFWLTNLEEVQYTG